MKRHEWDFEYSAKSLAQAAHGKSQHHQERMQWWERKKEEVMAKVKESGLTIHETPVSSYSNTTPGVAAQVMVDTTLQTDLNQCTGKLREHAAKMAEYAGWSLVLDAQGDARLRLHHDDWLFFFGK